MKSISKFSILTFLLVCFNSCAQEADNCNSELEKTIAPIIISLNEAREVYKTSGENYSKIIKLKIEKLNKLSSDHPEKFGDLKEKSNKIDRTISDLNDFIESLTNESKADHFDNFNYVMMSDTLFYYNILYDNQNSLSERGIKLKEKINSVHNTIDEILNSSQRELSLYNLAKFKTDVSFRDNNGSKIDYMDYKLMDRTVIGILSYLERLQLELVTFQYAYMNSIVQ